MIKKTTTIKNKLGLHARPIAMIVNLANGYSSKIKIKHKNGAADATSAIKLMLLQVSKDDKVEISAKGPDEVDAVQGIENLISSGFKKT